MKCRRRFREHVDGECPGLGGHKFLRHIPRFAASNSFGEPEVKALMYITRGLSRGADITHATRLEGFPGLCQKAQSMLQSIERKKERRGLG